MTDAEKSELADSLRTALRLLEKDCRDRVERAIARRQDPKFACSFDLVRAAENKITSALVFLTTEKTSTKSEADEPCIMCGQSIGEQRCFVSGWPSHVACALDEPSLKVPS